jgi:hypothetical protein
MIEKGDFWLPPMEIDPGKLKPRRLDSDEYDEMHTALASVKPLKTRNQSG